MITYCSMKHKARKEGVGRSINCLHDDCAHKDMLVATLNYRPSTGHQHSNETARNRQAQAPA